MARVATWYCWGCKTEWEAPGVGGANHVVSRPCPACGKGVARAWGRAAVEDGAMDVVDLDWGRMEREVMAGITCPAGCMAVTEVLS